MKDPNAIYRIGYAIHAIIPHATIERNDGPNGSHRVRVYSENPITLRQLKAIETIIGHDRIDLVPATFEYPLSEVTPGAGFERGFISFEWSA